MPNAAIKVEGLNKAIRTLRRLHPELVDEMKEVNKDLAASLVPVAKAKVPVQSGALRESIRSTGQARTGVVRAGKAKVPYAGPIHFGWPSHRIRPQPFLYEALDERRDEIEREYVRRVQRVIDRVE